MKRGKYFLYSLILIILLWSVGCSEPQENKLSETKKLEKIEKNSNLKSEIVEQQSSIEEFMPEKWKIINTNVIPAEKLDYYCNVFGGKILNIENNSVSSSEPYNYYKFKINVIRASDNLEAKKIFDTLLSKTSNKNKYLIREDVVYEFMANDDYIAKCRSIFSK